MLGHTQALLGYLAEAARNHVVGSDPFEIESLVQRMKYGDYGRAGEIVMSGIGCVEMACWDIVGKALGQPVYRLLGGAVNERVKAYANGWYTVERSPEEFHAAARRVIERGYRALKFDPFGEGRFELDHDERMRSVVAGRGGARRGRPGGRDPGRDARALRPARGDPGRAGCWSSSSRPGSRSRSRRRTSRRWRRSPSTRRCRWRPASASTTGSSSASCSSCRRRTSSSPTSATSAASWRRASWRRRPRRTTSSSRRTTSAGRC